jgi:hypothetical protein
MPGLSAAIDFLHFLQRAEMSIRAQTVAISVGHRDLKLRLAASLDVHSPPRYVAAHGDHSQTRTSL